MLSINQKKYYNLIFLIMIFGVLLFGTLCAVAKVVLNKKLNGCIFNKAVATVVDNFKNSNMVLGKNVVVTNVGVGNLKEGDYVVFNDFIGGVVRVDNCGKLVKIESEKNCVKLVIQSEINGEFLKLPDKLYLGRVEYFSQVECGWLSFVASKWASLIFVLTPFLCCSIIIYKLRKLNTIPY